MRLLVDGLVFEAPGHGGNLRIFQEVLPRLCDLEPDLEVSVITAGSPQQPLPHHERILSITYPPLERIIRPGRYFLWSVQRPVRAMVQFPWIYSFSPFIWHSSYYTLPARACGPIVTTVLDLLHERFTGLFNRKDDEWFRKQKRRCMERSDAIICISETTRQDVIHTYDINEKRVHVVRLAPGDTYHRQDPAERHETPVSRPYLLYVGGRSHYKNFGVLLRAYSKWTKRKEVDLVIVGSPLNETETHEFADLGLLSNVEVLSSVTDHRLCELYNRAVGFVYPSWYEGFGLPVLEAMACGCCVIASRIPSTVEIAGDVPIYFDPDNVESLIAALDLAWLEYPGGNIHRVDHGISQAAVYSWELTAQQTLQVYRNLMAAL